MKNYKSITPKQFELISRLIDNDLTNIEKENFYSEIEKSPVLKTEYKKVLKLKSLLHEVPEIKIKKSYRVTREMLNIPSFWGLASKGWSVISQVSIFAVVLLMGSQILSPQATAAPMAVSMEMEFAVSEDEAFDNASADFVVEMAEPAMNIAEESMDDSAIGEMELFSVDADGNNLEGRTVEDDNSKSVSPEFKDPNASEEVVEFLEPQSFVASVNEKLRNLNLWVYGLLSISALSYVISKKIRQ